MVLVTWGGATDKFDTFGLASFRALLVLFCIPFGTGMAAIFA